MNMWSIRALFQSTKSLPRDTQHAPLGKRSLSFGASVLLAPLLLAGCTDRAVSGDRAWAVQAVLPDSKVIDYRTAQCETIWYIDSSDALENGLYWLRTMDCADRLGAVQARALAKTLEPVGWSMTFKQGILLGGAEPSAAERRQIIERLNRARADFPGSLRPLLQLWREQQVLQIALMEEKARFQRLQDSTDSQIDALRESQSHLQYRLEDTTRKLENLTDIERQLSSRKQLQGDMPGESEARNAAAAVEKPAPVAAAEKIADELKTVPPAEPKPAAESKPATPAAEAKPIAEPVQPEQAAEPQKPAAVEKTEQPPAPSSEVKPAETYTPPAAPAAEAPAAIEESKPHDTTQTGQSTAG